MVLVSYWMDSYLLHISIHGTRKKVVMFIHFLHSLGTAKQYCTLVSSTSLKDLSRWGLMVGRWQLWCQINLPQVSSWNKHCLFPIFIFAVHYIFPISFLNIFNSHKLHWILNNTVKLSSLLFFSKPLIYQDLSSNNLTSIIIIIGLNKSIFFHRIGDWDLNLYPILVNHQTKYKKK